GRFRWERQVTLGLREIVVCDGAILLHLYPEIGVGARRTLSRFHRAELSALMPSVLPPIEDLATGADLDVAGDRTVVVIPHAGRHLTHLVFDDDGKLVERKLIDKTSGKLYRALKVDTETETAEAPNLRPSLRELVVLPLPWRAVSHVEEQYRVSGATPVTKLDDETAVALLAANFAERKRRTPQLIKERFLDRGDRRMGFFT